MAIKTVGAFGDIRNGLDLLHVKHTDAPMTMYGARLRDGSTNQRRSSQYGESYTTRRIGSENMSKVLLQSIQIASILNVTFS